MKRMQPKLDENSLHKIPLRITDTTLRDAHQSLWATRMRAEDIRGILEVIDRVGYYSLEVWGGATFDVCLRYLRENPWERLRMIKAKCHTPLQMLLRGQNVLGYRNYPDDLLDRFIALACENGIDIFRVFDALNDTRNLERAIASVKKYNAHAQGTICYTISPVHTVAKYVQVAKEQVRMGIDSLCIKDMAGILSPISAERLISALVREIHVPIQLHCHASSGMATATYVEGVRAGAGAIDCAISPLAGFSGQPPVETLMAIFSETTYHANLDEDALREQCKYFTSLAPRRQPRHGPMGYIDPDILSHQIPGGMISNLRSQLKQQDALDRLDEVLEELPRVREDLGYPPLVTPTSQIIGIQAVCNVLAGQRYKIVSNETKDYVRGLYGRPPAPIRSRIIHKILGDEKPIVCRPADLLEPMLPKATEGADPKLLHNEEDIVSYCLFPEQALEFFKWRSLPPEQRPPPPADVEDKQAAAAAQPAAPAAQPDADLDAAAPVPTPPEVKKAAAGPLLDAQDRAALKDLLGVFDRMKLGELSITRGGLRVHLKAGDQVTVSGEAGEQPAPAPASESQQPAAAAPAAESAGAAAPSAAASAEKAPAQPEASTNGQTIDAPLNGTLYLSSAPGKPNLVNVGDTVEEGAPVCVVEAMKLFNEIKAPAKCRIVKVLAEHGKPVTKNQPLMAIEKV